MQNMRALILHFSLLLFLCFSKSNGVAFAPNISPNPQPFLPSLGPSPVNNTTPALSELCKLNFSAVEDLLSITATDCWEPFAPYLANVICCPQFEATLVTLVGQSGRSSGLLALDSARSTHCLSDIEKILASKGANQELHKICSVRPETLLSQASCPVPSVDAFESLVVDSSTLLSACTRIDRVNECCKQACHTAISDAAQRIASTHTSISNEEHSKRVHDCKPIVLRWLATKLDPRSANAVLRVLSNCEVNNACPLAFPNTTSVVQKCGQAMTSPAACCAAVDDYASKLQKQSFVTNVQALHCASELGTKLQEMNVTRNIYDMCRVTIKDFSLQVGSQEFGCLLPSSPSDVTYDRESGISFVCDLNDNIAAPWPSSALQPFSFCNKTTEIPAIPKATSAQKGFHHKSLKIPLLFSFLAVLKLLL